MLDHGRIHQGHEKEIRDVSTFTAQHVGAARRSIWRDVTLTLRKHVGAARRDVTLTLRKNQPSRFKHVASIICYLCFMQYAWRCAFFFTFWQECHLRSFRRLGPVLTLLILLCGRRSHTPIRNKFDSCTLLLYTRNWRCRLGHSIISFSDAVKSNVAVYALQNYHLP